MIRRAGAEDADAIGALREASWRAAYAGLIPEAVIALACNGWAERVRAGMGKPDGRARNFVEEQDGKLRAWVCVGEARDQDVDPASVGEIWALYAAPAAWGTGAGRALFVRACEELRAAGRREVILWVLTSNARGRAFYERQGMKPDGAERVSVEAGTSLPHLRYRMAL